MRTVKIDGHEYPIFGTGGAVVVYTDEFHSDLFEEMNTFLDAFRADGMVSISSVSKLTYTLIKNANTDLLGSYREFMNSTHKVGDFLKKDNINSLIEEINDMMFSGEEEPKPSEKKRRTQSKV